MSKETAISNERAEWLSACAREFSKWAAKHRGQRKRFEDFRSDSRVCEPHHPGVWGGVAAQYVREGWLQPVGFAHASGPVNHRRIVRVYRVK